MMSKRKVKRNDITRSAFMSEVLSYDDIMNNGSSSSNSSSSSSSSSRSSSSGISNLPVNCDPSVNNNIYHDVVVDVGNSVDQHYQHTIVKSNSCDKVTEQIIRPSYRRRVIVYSDDDDDEVVNEDEKEDYAKDAKDDEEEEEDDDDDDNNKGDHNDHDFDEFNSNSSVEDEDGDITTDKSTHRSLSIPLSSSSEPFVIDLTSNQNVNRHHPTNQHQQQQQQHDLQDIRSSSSSSSTSLLSFNEAMLTNAEWLYHHLCSKFVHYEKTNLADGHVRFVS